MAAVAKIPAAAPALLLLLTALLDDACADRVTWRQCQRPYDMKRRVVVPNAQSPDNNATVIGLDSCNITEFNISDFINLHNIRIMYLRGNNIQKLDPAVFSHVPQLTELYLDDNSLRTVPIFGAKSVLPNLQVLYITSNQITALDDPRTFSSMKQLTVLRLDGNQIEHMNPDIFQELSELLRVDLSHNRIKFIPHRMFTLPNLTYVDLSYNQIEYVSPGAMRGIPFEYVFLYHNNLSYLPKHIVSDINYAGSLVLFVFFENPFQCACLKELIDDVRKFNKLDYGREHYDRKALECVLPEKLQCERVNETEYISHSINGYREPNQASDTYVAFLFVSSLIFQWRNRYTIHFVTFPTFYLLALTSEHVALTLDVWHLD